MDMSPEAIPPPPPPPRGTHHKRPLVMEEGQCLHEYALTKEVLGMQPVRMAVVKTICGQVERMLVKVWVYRKLKPTLMYADVVTGTLYLESGECMSSSKRRVVVWKEYRQYEPPPKQTGRTWVQDNWNEGI